MDASQMSAELLPALRDSQKQIEALYSRAPSDLPTTPAPPPAPDTLHRSLPQDGHGLHNTTEHLWKHVAPGLDAQSLSPTYYGFVTGGVTPAARIADNIVTAFDQNVHVHLPEDNVTTHVDHNALRMLAELFAFDPSHWPVRTFTTGATGSNTLGLCCAREHLITTRLAALGLAPAEGEGLLPACARAGIQTFQILSTMPHSSLRKAANIAGLGSASIIDVSEPSNPLTFNLPALEAHLRTPHTASIIAVSSGEVNTGFFATHSAAEMHALRTLCDKHGAWLHADAAFGLFARALPNEPAYARVAAGAAGLELADSIASDAHKLLNVPYDAGFFFARHADACARVGGNVGAAYLAVGGGGGGGDEVIASPLHVHLENSSRFRALPVYASLVAYGRAGYQAMLERMVLLARRIAGFVRDCAGLELLPVGAHDKGLEDVFMVVLFRARDEVLNGVLTGRIKASKRVYASGTVWDGRPATRLAVAKWNVDVERDFEVVREVLMELLHDQASP